MNLPKLILAFILSILILSIAIADSGMGIKSKKSNKQVTSKIKILIRKLKFDLEQLDFKSVKLKCFVTENGGLLVLSTEQSKLDGIFKSSLNYKKVNTNTLKYNKVYILPVSFK